MGEIVDGIVVLTEKESRRLAEYRAKERARPTTEEDLALIYAALSMR